MKMEKMITIMNMKNKIFTLIFLSFAFTANASELIDTANQDWLELVRKYSNESEIKKTDDYKHKWDKLVNGSSKDNNFLSEWWSNFGDEVLTELIEKAFSSNKDLEAARAKVLEARAQLGIARTNFNPKADFEATYEHGRNSDMADIENKNYDEYSIGFDASWEIDFFGKNKHTLNAAKANLESEYANLYNAWVSLSAEVAMNYVNLRILQGKLEITKNNLNAQNEFLEILQSQYKSGLIDESGVKQAQYDIEITRANIPEITQSIKKILNAIAILTGEIPGSLDEKLTVQKKFPEIEISEFIGIPAETLRQRPDIRAAERKLTAQIQTRKATEKSLYPVIQLLGSIGLESFSTGHLFSSGSYNYSILPKISWPIFHVSEIKKNIQVQTAIEKQLAAELENVILKAVGEVQDAINANLQEFLRNKSLNDALTTATYNLEISKNKYSNGLVDFKDVLKNQQAVYSIENEFLSSNGQKFINLIALFKSLGGSWKTLNE